MNMNPTCVKCGQPTSYENMVRLRRVKGKPGDRAMHVPGKCPAPAPQSEPVA